MSLLNQLNVLLFTIIIITPHINSLPSGAPPTACQRLSPAHGFATTRPAHTSPFTVEAVVRREGRDDRAGGSDGKIVVQVDIVPKAGFPTFRGFIAQARLASNPGIIVDAAWLPQEPMLSKTFVCGGANRQPNTWTHSSALPKHRISALLVPPPGFSGQIVIQATVVATRDTFWEGLFSKEVNLVIHSPTNAVIIEQPAINELLDAVSYNVMDMEPDFDSEFYGIGEPDEVLYLRPKVEDDEDDKKTDKEETSKTEIGEAKKCAKSKTTNKKKEKENALKTAEDNSNDEPECLKEESGSKEVKPKPETPLKKTLTVDDLVIESGDLEQEENWEDAFNFAE